MKPLKIILLVTSTLFFSYDLHAQLDITDGATAPFNPQNLVENVFLGSGVEVLSVQYQGDPKAVGFFSGANGNIGLERGIIMSTARVNSIDTPNNGSDDVGADDATSGGSIDDDLAMIATDVLEDVARYTIKFIPAADTLRFRYVFASEEYPEFVCGGFNDVFGFFVTGENPDGGAYNSQNIALIPDPSDPSGLTFTNTPVAIDNVHDGSEGTCAASFEEYYNINPPGTQNFKLDAYTSVFTAEAIVVPCTEYTINLAIADVGDNNYGSSVFLEAKSFGTGTLEVGLNSLAVDGSLAEGCGTGALEFTLPEVVTTDYIIDIQFFTPPNAATPDVDYPAIPDQLIIPAGSNSVSVPLEAFLDGESEADEVISFEIQVDICNRKRFEILIRDDDLFAPILPADTVICDGETLLIDSELDPNFILPDDPYFENTDGLSITPEKEPIYSDIVVAGVIPTILQPNIIESVCILGLEHRDLTDFDIYLISPGGQFLELSTDNGFKPNNIADVDRYENTCFTPFATENINNGENLAGPIFDANPTYTGEFAPEGVWGDLWDGQNPTNGKWRLLVIDDTNGFEGTLEGWSITFRSFYGLTYEWSSDPVTTLCENCEDISVSPTEDTEYTLKVIDSYGCERSASMLVEVDPSLTSPSPTCGMITENSLEVTWNDVVDNEGYEIRIDGGPWISVGALNYTFLSLASSTDFVIEVKAVGPNCDSQPTTLNCRTNDCAQPIVTVSIDSDASCANGNDGEVSLSATGSGPFTYEIDGVSNSTGIFTTVQSGMNTYKVTDASGCALVGDFMIDAPDPFTLSSDYTYSDPCNVVSGITGMFTVTGATPAYSFNWSSGSTDPEAPNLSPGIYSLTISDAEGCDTIVELDIPALDPLVWSVGTTSPLCKDEENGIAEVLVTTGTAPFTYQWEDGSDEQVNANLEEGNYVVTLTDALGCEEFRLFTIDPGAELTAMIIPMDASCKGQDDGSASVSVSGGLGPYNFFWNGGTSNDDEVDGLAAGSYTLMVSDVNSCMVAQDFVIGEPDGISFDTSKVNNVCYDASEGQIVVEGLISPNGTVSIDWDDGSNAFMRMGLSDGTYCFTLDDGTSCTLSECLTITSPDEIEIEETVAGPRCLDTNDGSISLEVIGGNPPYSFAWTGPVGAGSLPPSASLTDLLAGDYTITITDGNSCMKEATYTVEAASQVSIDSSVFPISCNGEATGQIFFSASGGDPPFTYEWIGPDGFSASTNNIQNVPAGLYTVTYEDAAGCAASLAFTIEEPAQALLANITSIDSVCNGLENGSLAVNPSGGSGPYTIEWSNGSSSAENLGLAPGDYTVTVTDSRLCTSVQTAEVVEIGMVNFVVDQTPSRCFQTSDGEAMITSIAYGTESANTGAFEVSWNSIPEQTGLLATGLVGGQEYIVQVSDSRGCTGIQSVLIETPEPVDAEATNIQDVKCFGGDDGGLTITGVGGTGTYTYAWDANAGGSEMNAITDLKRGNYVVTITDDNSCVGISSFTINEPRPLDLDFRKVDASCFQGNDGRAEAAVSGGTIPYQYTWSVGGNSQAIESLASDWYYLTITDDNACELRDSVLITQPEEAISAGFTVDPVTCFGGRDGRIEVEASGGSGFYRYSLDGNSFSSTSIFPNLIAGNYTVYVNDFKGCVDTFTEVLIFEPDEIVVDLGPDRVIPFGSTTELSASIFNTNGNLTYRWNSANLELLSCTDCSTPTFDGQREASYELQVIDMGGCLGNDFVTIRLENFSPLFVPTAFTPNNDGENDVLELFGKGIKSVNKFSIYDRWGELVYELLDQEINIVYQSWNGLFKGKEAPSGIYYWFADVEFENGFQENFNGNTSLLR